MKKSVIILIAIIYISSIALVSFFGLQHKTFNEIVYVEKVEIINENCNVDPDGGKYVTVKDSNQFQIEWRVYPDNASNIEVDFVYDTTNTKFSVDENGVVTCSTGKGAITVHVVARDGTGARDTILINFRN